MFVLKPLFELGLAARRDVVKDRKNAGQCVGRCSHDCSSESRALAASTWMHSPAGGEAVYSIRSAVMSSRTDADRSRQAGRQFSQHVKRRLHGNYVAIRP